MSTDDAAVEAVMRVLSEHRIECTGYEGVTCRGCRERGWISSHTYREHVAREVVAALADQHRADVDEPWPFGSESAAVLVAKTAWPYDAHASDWARRLANEPEMRESTATRAEARLRSAVAHLRNEADQ